MTSVMLIAVKYTTLEQLLHKTGGREAVLDKHHIKLTRFMMEADERWTNAERWRERE